MIILKCQNHATRTELKLDVGSRKDQINVVLSWKAWGQKYNLNEKRGVLVELLTVNKILDLEGETTGACNSIVRQQMRVRVTVSSQCQLLCEATRTNLLVFTVHLSASAGDR